MALFVAGCRGGSEREGGGAKAPVGEAPRVASASAPASAASSCAPQPRELAPSEDRPTFGPVVEDPKEGRHVVARWYAARIFAAPSSSATVIGYARRGSRLRIRTPARGDGCPADMWVELAAGGFACAAKDFRPDGTSIPDPVRPTLDAALPFGYGKVIHEGAPRLERLPSASEKAALAAARRGERSWPELVRGTMDGAYFVTITETVEDGGDRWYRTDGGDLVAVEDVERLEPPRTVGRALNEDVVLPLAFVREDTPLRCRCEDALVDCGIVRTHASFAAAGETTRAGEAFVESKDGRLVARSAVRLAGLHERPDDVPADARWVHVDLGEQTLVAYEGDRPVRATVVASGTGPKHATPAGLFQVERRFITTTMSGPDEDKGTYTVSEVPWTLYFQGDLALHGAYWHDAFGAERSHGCVNLPPADARWLFGWSGRLPAGWHAAAETTEPWVWITP